MTDRDETFGKVTQLIAPFNKKGVALTEGTTFSRDLEWDSLTVMDFVAAIEDEFDILITMNMQADIETVGQLVDAVEELRNQGESRAWGTRPDEGFAQGSGADGSGAGSAADARSPFQIRPAD